MNQVLTPPNLLKGLAIALKINIFSFIAAVIIGVGWTYMFDGFWDWEYFNYLCVFYSITISLTLLIKKWYRAYLQRKETTQI